MRFSVCLVGITIGKAISTILIKIHPRRVDLLSKSMLLVIQMDFELTGVNHDLPSSNGHFWRCVFRFL